jgi:hypothetical protein
MYFLKNQGPEYDFMPPLIICIIGAKKEEGVKEEKKIYKKELTSLAQ